MTEIYSQIMAVCMSIHINVGVLNKKARRENKYGHKVKLQHVPMTGFSSFTVQAALSEMVNLIIYHKMSAHCVTHYGSNVF